MAKKKKQSQPVTTTTDEPSPQFLLAGCAIKHLAEQQERNFADQMLHPPPGMEGFAASMIAQNILRQQELILIGERGWFEYPEVSIMDVARDKARYVELWGQALQSFGASFIPLFNEARRGHNEIARLNLERGARGAWVLPAFDPLTGDHLPLFPGDYWGGWK